MFVVINVIILLICLIFFILRFKNSKQIRLIDFIIILFCLFYPLGLIRPMYGYDSIIGYDLFKNEFLLDFSSILVFIFLILFLFGIYTFNLINKKNKIKRTIIFRKITYMKYLNIFTSAFVIILMLRFVFSQGNILEYFYTIDSVRQSLSGQMLNFLIIYLNFLITIYIILVEKKVGYIAYLTTAISIVSFAVYGFRGPVITIIITLIIVLQIIDKIQIKLNIKYMFFLSLFLFLFVFSQELRENIVEINKEPFFITLLARFNGYEPLSVILDKVVIDHSFDIKILVSNFLSFIELPIPRSILPEKEIPVSLLLAKDIFYDIGIRNFETGGISPTIVGSLIWNFHLFGIMLSFFFGYFIAKLEYIIFYSTNNEFKLLSISLGMYFVLSIEAPENSLGVLWLLMISSFSILVIEILYKHLLRKKNEKNIND